MTAGISIKQGDNFIHSRVSGVLTESLLSELMTKTSAMAHKLGFSRYLADLRKAKKILGTIEDYNLAYGKARKYGFQFSSKHALIVSQNELDAYNFVETVFKNAGYNLRVFTEESPALTWIQT